MRILDSAAALADALARPLDSALRQLLLLRRDQLGGDIEDVARFIIIEPPDSAAEVEAAIGFPMLLDDMPAWEWSERHDDWTEVVFVFGEAADVLLIPDRDDLDPALTALMLDHIAPADDRLHAQAP